jgi:uncharacterized protein
MDTLSLLVKPAANACNLACDYCFYRREVYHNKTLMSPETAEALISRALATGADRVVFTWQGGEPTLMGLDFYERAVNLQHRLAGPGQMVVNTLQTNGLLIDEAWCRFLHDENWLVGLSLDGPAQVHDVYRRGPGGRGSFERVMAAARLMQARGVQFNVLAMLTDQSVTRPESIYGFFRDEKFSHLQFIPCFEGEGPVSCAVNGDEVGDFYCRLFDAWLADGFPQVSIRFFEDILIYFFDRVRASCRWLESCDSYLVVEHNGDVYPCDFFVQPEWLLGNLKTDDWDSIVHSPRRREFAARKSHLPAECLDCLIRPFCQGDCPRYRRGPDGERVYCSALKRLVEHMEPSLPRIVAEAARHRG